MAIISQNTIYGIGLVALDLVVSAEPCEPVFSWAGGTCGNVLTIMSYLGWNAFPVARLNGDPASNRVREDFRRWGVHLDFAECTPTTDTPIIVQKINRDSDGSPSHMFNWECLQCGRGLPRFKPVTFKSACSVMKRMGEPAVFFADRLSNASLALARHAAKKGALVVFEPSMVENPSLMAEMLSIAHVVKYSSQRLNRVLSTENDSVLLEIQSLGSIGLRFRQPQNRKAPGWTSAEAFLAPSLRDTCGSGDWLTAGFLSKVGQHGLDGFRALDSSALQSALTYGQALSAWNCGYEGARGGMYSVLNKKQFQDQINAILAGHRECFGSSSKHGRYSGPVSCPSCSSANVSNYNRFR
jgi:fructokinase